MQPVRTFSEVLHERPALSGLDVVCRLRHFAIITYAFDPARFSQVMPGRFRLDTVEIDGEEKALLSVVPFLDAAFTSAVFPFPRFTMGQTNYRIYIVDTQSGEKCVWFLGTTLDSWTRVVPYYFWTLPWYAGRVRFDCDQRDDGSYARYSMTTRARWAPALVELDSGDDFALPGFPDIEAGLVFLTHPLRGFYHRRDGRLGSYDVWHERIMVAPGRLKRAEFGLLDRLGLVSFAEQQHPHSTLIDAVTEFTIYLPPKVVDNELTKL